MEEILLKKKNKTKQYLLVVFMLMIMIGVVGMTYAFFNYTRTGAENVIETGLVYFNFQDGTNLNLTNQFPISTSNISNTQKLTFSITSHTTLANGIDFNVYAVPGDVDNNRTRLTDNIMKIKFEAPSNGDGFSITNNYYSTGATPTYTNGEALLATGHIQDTNGDTTKTYSVYLWIDEASVFVSSTTKRANNLEGNPSLADATTGNVTASRYMKNDNVATNVTLYPAKPEAQGKIIYTTNEFSNSYYSIKIKVEANDVDDVVVNNS